jgi:diketogulonate reductase-like aldo/keto reductase
MCLVLSLLLLGGAVRPVEANFFARKLMMASDADDPPAPATAALMQDNFALGNAIAYGNDGVLMAVLSNNNRLPLIGLGVGNLPSKYVSRVISHGLNEEHSIRLIDTSHIDDNEEMVVKGILHGIKVLEDNVKRNKKRMRKVQVHVLTKVWYTHLGYERTKLAVEETIKNFAPVINHKYIDFKLHVLLHWPRCYDTIPWMDCEKEEAQLPEHVKTIGPDPTLARDTAWKDSWKLLEDMYLSEKYPVMESIGVSNFHLGDLQHLESFARIHPHILQMNVWSLVNDEPLVHFCHTHRIHIQVYNALAEMEPEKTPNAYHHVQKVGYELSASLQKLYGHDEDRFEDWYVTPTQVVLAWLIQHGVSVIPRTKRVVHVTENAAVPRIPLLDDTQVDTVMHAIDSFLTSNDMEADIHVKVAFHAVNKDIMVFWHADDGSEIRIAHVKQGESFEETTYPHHLFRTYDASNKDVYLEHRIVANFGDYKNIHVEL